jgi:catechol 2,3-dioxygenase-like lactoylglutathione lyase family enzyme
VNRVIAQRGFELEMTENSGLAFYTGVLGLRLVKVTVNFDDPRSYHLYYGDGRGNPGTRSPFIEQRGGLMAATETLGQFHSDPGGI